MSTTRPAQPDERDEGRRRVDVLLVSLGSTHGWRVADAALAESLRRAGASVELVTAERPREVRTLMLTDLTWARAARRAARRGIAEHAPRAVLYSTTTAALRWPVPGAIRFDDLAANNRPGRHGLWQRRVERRRIEQAPLLVPMGYAAAIGDEEREVVVPPPIEPSAPLRRDRDIAAITYASDPVKKGLDRVLAAWARVRRPGEELVVVTEHDVRAPGVRVERVRGQAFRALVARSRVYVAAPRREDYGIAQLEALADGCVLVTTEAEGPYEALGLARRLDPRLVGDDLATALRTALDDPLPGYAAAARVLLEPYRTEVIDRTVAEELLPRLLATGPAAATG
jgi:glycosyltransferase involved in cell wall biosynthesis